MSFATDDIFQVSVVIPVRNRPDVLRRNLSALASQDFASKDFEVLVCDDGSTDDIQSVVESFRMVLNVQLLKQKPKGPAGARNLGIRESIAPIVIF